MAPEATTGSIALNVYDGTRKLLSSGPRLLVTIIDGNQQKRFSRHKKGPSLLFRLPFFNNFGDNYTVIVSAKGFQQAGFHPVHISTSVIQSVDLLLLPKPSRYNFADAQWGNLKNQNPKLVELLSSGAASEVAAKKRYSELTTQKPDSLAALLNIITAMKEIHLPAGGPMDYLRQLIWDETLAQDRFFAWAEETLLAQVKLAASHGLFKPEHGAAVFHPGATSSYKQVQFGEANVQITFHEEERRRISGVQCLKVELDIDYFKDLGAHTLLEVIPNLFSQGKTDPKTVYVLRWIAGRHAGVAEFNPPYTIETDRD